MHVKEQDMDKLYNISCICDKHACERSGIWIDYIIYPVFMRNMHVKDQDMDILYNLSCICEKYACEISGYGYII